MTTTASSPVQSRLDQIQSTLDVAYAKGWVPTESGKQVKTFPTGMSAPAGMALRELVRAERAVTTLETGFALGLSTLWIMGATLATSDSASHVAVDPFQKSDWGNSGKESVRRAGLTGVVEHVSQDSLTYLPQITGEERVFDFILVDGGHWFENAFIDLFFALRLVRPGGLVAIDDLWMPAVKHAVRYATTNLGATQEFRADLSESKRFALLRSPLQPVQRKWDHFVAFAEPTDFVA